MDPEYVRRMVEQLRINPQTIRAMEQAAGSWQQARIDPQTMRAIKRRLHIFQRPAWQEYISNTLRYQGIGEQVAALSQFRLLLAALRPSITLNTDAVRAAEMVARSDYLQPLKNIGKQFAQLENVGLSYRALTSAQFTAAQLAIRSFLPDANLIMAQSTLASLQEHYAQTLRTTTKLLSDPNLRRMLERAESKTLIEVAVEIAQETGTPLGDVDAQETEYGSLDPGPAADTLLPYISWSIVVLSVALTVSYADPQFAEYIDTLTQIILWLTILERALKQAREDHED